MEEQVRRDDAERLKRLRQLEEANAKM